MTRRTVRHSLLLLFVLRFLPSVAAEQPAVGPDDFRLRGVGFEAQFQWQQAADLYERAIRYYPNDADLHERWFRSERRYSLSRRYCDASYTHTLLKLDESTALDLYQEVLAKIQTHFVDSVELNRLIRQGYQHLQVALQEDSFYADNRITMPMDRRLMLLSALRRRVVPRIEGIYQASHEVKWALGQCRAHGFTAGAPIILEFTAAAAEGLDSYTAHLSPDRLKDIYSVMDGNFVGLGIEVRGIDGGLEICSVIDPSPARRAGLDVGDRIRNIDGKDLAHVRPEEAANLLQGAEGSACQLVVLPRESETERKIALQREQVVVHSVVDAQMLDPDAGVGYLRLTSFQKRTAQELEAAVTQLETQGLRSLIIDLRNNPGGLLDVGLVVANRFIDQGVLLSTKGRAWGQSWSHRARSLKSWKFPLAVLVNGESASAAEIFASAVQDHQRGTIVGERTYGKGSVQSIFPLQTASTGLRLTTAHFFSPKQRKLQDVGVLPDVVARCPSIDPLQPGAPLEVRRALADDPPRQTALALLRQSPPAKLQLPPFSPTVSSSR